MPNSFNYILNPRTVTANHPAKMSHLRRTLATSAPRVVFSGIQPTGVPHLGNYLGALRTWADIQSSASPDTQLIFSIVDLHAITQPQNAETLRKARREMLAAILAVGIDPKRCTLFEQSRVPHHVELMWILSCGASTGYLSRMTQWKVYIRLPFQRGRRGIGAEWCWYRVSLG